MAEGREPAIKLFGKTIQLPAVREALVFVSSEKKFSPITLESPSNNQEHEKDASVEQNISVTNEQKTNPKSSCKAKDQQNKSSNNPTDKPLQKPDKILPCPRCNSMETKFCYFNNYNVNQPRHFCKYCQRYWTEGGSMRNVPVGAGRRKTKSSTTNHHITIPAYSQSDLCESISQLNPLKPNGTILRFGGADAPLCESMDPNCADQISGSLVTTLNSNDEGNCHASLPYLNPWSHTPFHQMTPCWGMPWLRSGLNSSKILGKHSREENTLNHSNSEKEKCLWIPKTLRIDDHEKAAKCSVWATLGFNNNKADGVIKKNRSTEASQYLRANPAALSRSLSFQRDYSDLLFLTD